MPKRYMLPDLPGLLLLNVIVKDAHLPTLHGVEWNAGQQRAAGLLDGWGV